jgi:stage V sporulation protein SpoVS
MAEDINSFIVSFVWILCKFYVNLLGFLSCSKRFYPPLNIPGVHVTETEAELQLRVWKELAISKQRLMAAATDALKLDKDCSPEELRLALEATIKRSAEAEQEVIEAQEQATLAVADAEKQLAEKQKSLVTTEAALAEVRANEEKLQQQLVTERANHAQQLKKVKDQLIEKERAIKTISTTLSDSPENVVKKLKALKKQKLDESEARKKAEEALSVLRKEKRKLEQSLKELQAEKDESGEEIAA